MLVSQILQTIHRMQDEHWSTDIL